MPLNETLVLFDVDGTLTKHRNVITQDVNNALKQLSDAGAAVGIVGGSDFCKIAEQLDTPVEELKKKFDYVFSENGLVGFEKDPAQGYVELSKTSMLEYLGEETMQKLINFCLGYMSKITLPCKRGTFIEFRRGMLNVSPIGRACSQKERDQFSDYDKQHNIRSDMVEALKSEFSNYDIKFSIGGQISIDAFPIGWDKTYSLQFVENKFKEIHFVGDRTGPGGNDYEIFNDSRTIGHTVTSPNDTIAVIHALISSSAAGK